MSNQATVIGAGLAGCEAAWALANQGVKVTLYEMKPHSFSPAHSSPDFAELVCSNSFKAKREGTAGGLLKAEMRLLDSLLLDCADQTEVPAGGALAVDRNKFSALVTERVKSHPNIKVEYKEIQDIPKGNVIIATGPLTSDALAQQIQQICGESYLSFYDAAAPIIEGDSINMESAFYATRYDKGDADYINCPLNEDEYNAFYNALVEAETVKLREFEKQNIYEGCIPVEFLANRGRDTLRYGPLKPVGLTDPKTGKRPWAVVQLRKEDTAGSQFNMVGFQTNLKWPEQDRVFSMIPGLENAEFARYGVMHRNTFIDSPKLLNSDFSMRNNDKIYFAGQITGVEGYMESAASGIIAGQNLARKLQEKPALVLPEDTMIGALTRYVSNPNIINFQPMGANMGILPKLDVRMKKKERYEALSQKALQSLETAIKTQQV